MSGRGEQSETRREINDISGELKREEKLRAKCYIDYLGYTCKKLLPKVLPYKGKGIEISAETILEFICFVSQEKCLYE